MKIEIKILNKEFYCQRHISKDNYETWETETKDLPQYATNGSAALDLRCTQDVVLYPGETELISTGLAIWIGSHFNNKNTYDQPIDQSINVAGLILPRSGLGTKGLVLANTIGLIDEDYQGELKIAAWNRNTEEKEYFEDRFGVNDPIKLKAGDRVAQLMFVPVIKAQWKVVEEFSTITNRNFGGFGSTGE